MKDEPEVVWDATLYERVVTFMWFHPVPGCLLPVVVLIGLLVWGLS